MTARLASLLALVQVVLGLRVACRLLRTGGEAPIGAVTDGVVDAGAVTVIVPVLNEVERLAPCLERLRAQGPEVGEILVVDSGSTDGTRSLVRQYVRGDGRMRLIEAGRAPDDWNGKVWGLHHGAAAVGSDAEWILTLDADVAVEPGLAAALVVRARERSLALLSAATQQYVSGAAQGLLHPAMLASLVVRFGRPNVATSRAAEVLANGQCYLIHRDLLCQLGGFEKARGSLCEDVTLARLAAQAGEGVGFYETEGLIQVRMFSDWREALRNWPRSLAMRDSLFGMQGWFGLAEVLFAQALPLPLLLLQRHGAVRRVNLLLLAMRLGLLCGIARAYAHRQWTFWVSPLADLPVALALWRSALAPHHTWRGRTYVRKKGSIVPA